MFFFRVAMLRKLLVTTRVPFLQMCANFARRRPPFSGNQGTIERLKDGGRLGVRLKGF